MQYMGERLGAWQVGDDPKRGAVQFKVFFPNRADPNVTSIRIPGSFQDSPWDWTLAPSMTRQAHPEGTLSTYTTPVELPAGFYEYKYLVSFANGEVRWVSDPCTRYGGSTNQNAAIAVGGTWP